MSALIECVANFSEGRRPDVIESIVHAINHTDGAVILGYERDADHNRAVVTFVGAPEPVADAAFAGIRRASQLIDMEGHHGQHPRIGAADVIPFIPLRHASMEDCTEFARRLGARVGNLLQLPVFLYERAALQDNNRNLADIRRGGYERLTQTIAAGEPPQPDFGPREMGKAGGCIIGARELLIAFNVFLTTADVAVARKIARTIRESSGGLPHVKALGFRVRGKAQVSMNLTNYRQTSMRRVFEAIQDESLQYGAKIVSSEIVGFIPRDALSDGDVAELKIVNFSPARVLEERLADLE